MARDSHSGHTFDPAAPFDHVWGSPAVGVAAGLYGGVVMAFVMMILNTARGHSLWEPYRFFSAAIAGQRALSGGSGMTLLGLVIHFGTSIVLGMLFAWTVGPTTKRRQLGLGLAFAIFTWAAAQFVILPLIAPAVATELGTLWPFFVGHLAYGLSLASVLPTVHDIDSPPTALV